MGRKEHREKERLRKAAARSRQAQENSLQRQRADFDKETDGLTGYGLSIASGSRGFNKPNSRISAQSRPRVEIVHPDVYGQYVQPLLRRLDGLRELVKTNPGQFGQNRLGFNHPLSDTDALEQTIAQAYSAISRPPTAGFDDHDVRQECREMRQLREMESPLAEAIDYLLLGQHIEGRKERLAFLDYQVKGSYGERNGGWVHRIVEVYRQAAASQGSVTVESLRAAAQAGKEQSLKDFGTTPDGQKIREYLLKKAVPKEPPAINGGKISDTITEPGEFQLPGCLASLGQSGQPRSDLRASPPSGRGCAPIAYFYDADNDYALVIGTDPSPIESLEVLDGRILHRTTVGNVRILAIDQWGISSQDMFRQTGEPAISVRGPMISDPENPLPGLRFNRNTLNFDENPDRAKALADFYNERVLGKKLRSCF